ncbi:Conserved hypothetical protein CHP00147 [Rhizobium sp. PDO1-076]|uniref:diacylglycerol/lipid kinase family protein n=1 Tax=Rhizobium sp. PDO1-076 TaxID=1125979 RepID=UPI00024E2F6B|nr:diacylglycerol kinase family protein [Rhizobium sp. PDO1-076]EHS49168.1 Conserved hypothetical protein CHP00147 [Rhizobium sp. PDO1-076]
MKIAIIRNPAAGGGKNSKFWNPARDAFVGRFPGIDIHESRFPGDVNRLAAELADAGYDLIIAAGGDGTINEVVDGVLKSTRPQTAISLMPLGTGCDFVRNFVLPKDPAALAERIANASSRRIDAGRIVSKAASGETVSRYFANITSVGISGEIVEAVNAPGKRKLLGGPARFLYHSIRAILNFRPYMFTVRIDGTLIYEGPLAIAAIANGGWFGGGMHCVPQADLSDGLFDVAVMRQDSVLGLLDLLGRLYSASHIGHPKLSFHRGRKVEIQPLVPKRFPVEVDGETLVEGGFIAEIQPGALTIRI